MYWALRGWLVNFAAPRGLAVAFISPALLLLLGMSVFPLLWALYLSFTDYSATRDVPANFIGYGTFALAAMVGVAYLLKAKGKLADRLPPLEVLAPAAAPPC